MTSTATPQGQLTSPAVAPQPVPTSVRRWQSLWPIPVGVGSGLLLWCGFFPLNWGWLGWVALVPFLYLTIAPSPRFVYLGAWLGGLAFGVPAVQWVRHAAPEMYAAWVGLALLLALHFLLFVAFSRWLVLTARIPLLIAAPCVWVALEFLRAHFDIGFAWYLLGHTQHDYLVLIQAADLFGAYGLSFLVMLGNVLLLQAAIWGWDKYRAAQPRLTSRQLAISAVTVLALLLAVLGYGIWRLQTEAFEAGPRVALVQGNVPQETRNDPSQGREQNAHFLELGRQAALQSPDLIAFPETSFTNFWCRIPPDQKWEDAPADWRLAHRDSDFFGSNLTGAWQAPILLGINSLEYRPTQPDGRHVNSAVLLDRHGKELGRYDKCCRVPFGEYIPFRETLPIMAYLSPYDHDYGIAAGEQLTLFQLPGERTYGFGVLICYEDSVPHLATEFLRLADQANAPLDFFLNISNDGWFRGSEEHEQHLVAARFRAVECRRAVARAVNMGISAVIDGSGRIVALPAATWGESKGVAGVVTAAIPIDQRRSLYVRMGDVLCLLCLGVLAVGMVLAVIRRRYQPSS